MDDDDYERGYEAGCAAADEVVEKLQAALERITRGMTEGGNQMNEDRGAKIKAGRALSKERAQRRDAMARTIVWGWTSHEERQRAIAAADEVMQFLRPEASEEDQHDTDT